MGLKSSGGAGIGRVHGVVAAAGADSVAEVTPGVAELSPLPGELSLSLADGAARGPRTGGLFGLKSRVFIRLMSPIGISPVALVATKAGRGSEELGADSTGVTTVSMT